MKHVIMTTLVLFTVAIVPLAHSQIQPVVYLNVGAAVPSAPELFSNRWDRGFNVGGGIGFSLTPHFTLQGYVDYNNLKLNEENLFTEYPKLGERVSVEGGELKLLTISGNVKALLVPPKSTIAPYVIGGTGFYKQDVSDILITGKLVQVELGVASKTTFAVGVGAGLDINLTDTIAFFIEGKYTIGFTENFADKESIKYVPVKIGLAFKL